MQINRQKRVSVVNENWGERWPDKPEGGGSIPSPATIKKFQQFGIRWNEEIGKEECPYLYRWVVTLFGYSIRLHHWLASDDQRYSHDHPWNYCAFILAGRYLERSEGKLFVKSRGCFTRYLAEHRHTVVILEGETCWSLLFTGRQKKDWGFYIPGRNKLLRPLRYFSRYGHHPCEN